jgi:hypothetical protein
MEARWAVELLAGKDSAVWAGGGKPANPAQPTTTTSKKERVTTARAAGTLVDFHYKAPCSKRPSWTGEATAPSTTLEICIASANSPGSMRLTAIASFSNAPIPRQRNKEKPSS